MYEAGNGHHHHCLEMHLQFITEYFFIVNQLLDDYIYLACTAHLQEQIKFLLLKNISDFCWMRFLSIKTNNVWSQTAAMSFIIKEDVLICQSASSHLLYWQALRSSLLFCRESKRWYTASLSSLFVAGHYLCKWNACSRLCVHVCVARWGRSGSTERETLSIST